MVDFEVVKKLRTKLGLSQTEAAKKAGFPPQQWHDIESGRRPDLRISTIDKIAKALGVKSKDLLK